MSTLFDQMPGGIVWFCTVLAFVIPYLVYKINMRLHKYGDPPWKKENPNK